MKNKLILVIMIGIISLMVVGFSLADTQQSLPVQKEGSTVLLYQGCTNSTFSNITSISVNSIKLSGNASMIQTATNYYEYNFTTTNQTGDYVVSGICDESGVITPWNYDFFVNPEGITQSSVFNNPIFLILLLLALVFLGFGMALKISAIGFIGSILLLVNGIYVEINGVNSVNNFYTQVIAIVAIGLGLILMFISAYEYVWGGSLNDGVTDEK
jgi:hypothetical protein